MDLTTTRLVALAITAVWSGSVAASIFIPGYQVPVEIHAIMGLVTGALFGKGAITKIRNGNGNGNGSH